MFRELCYTKEVHQRQMQISLETAWQLFLATFAAFELNFNAFFLLMFYANTFPNSHAFSNFSDLRLLNEKIPMILSFS
jgi:hypothetical protein